MVVVVGRGGGKGVEEEVHIERVLRSPFLYYHLLLPITTSGTIIYHHYHCYSPTGLIIR